MVGAERRQPPFAQIHAMEYLHLHAVLGDQQVFAQRRQFLVGKQFFTAIQRFGKVDPDFRASV